MARLSVNVNKVATLRNSRGGAVPSVLDAVRVCVDAGAPGITVHPRADERHIRERDVYEVAEALEGVRDRVEYNIEGDPRPGFAELVDAVGPDQCTLVPVRPVRRLPTNCIVPGDRFISLLVRTTGLRARTEAATIAGGLAFWGNGTLRPKSRERSM